METKSQSGGQKTTVLLGAVIVLLLVVILVVVVGRRPAGQEAEDSGDSGTPKLTYAEGVTMVNDPNALQKAVDEMYADDGNITLEYQGSASSTDGETFSCYIANAVENDYDMFIAIYADVELTDQVYLSGLVRPGNAFDEIKLEHPLDQGTNRVYVAFTQVEEDLETIHGQVVVTMDFVVGG